MSQRGGSRFSGAFSTCSGDTEWLMDTLRSWTLFFILIHRVTCFFKGYMMKKGHKRKNWTERWFLLKPSLISYYVSEDLTEKKGDILLDGNCCVEARAHHLFLLLTWLAWLLLEVLLHVSAIVMVTSFWWTNFLFLWLWWPHAFLHSLYLIRRAKSAFSTSSALTKALKSVPPIRRKNKSGFKVRDDSFYCVSQKTWTLTLYFLLLNKVLLFILNLYYLSSFFL